MGRDFITTLALVHLDDTVGVDGEALVRVDGHAEETGVGLQCPLKTLNQHIALSKCRDSRSSSFEGGFPTIMGDDKLYFLTRWTWRTKCWGG